MTRSNASQPVSVTSQPARTLQSSMMTMQSNAKSHFAHGKEVEIEQQRLAVDLGKTMIAGKTLRAVQRSVASCQ